MHLPTGEKKSNRFSVFSLFAILLRPSEDINLTDNNPFCEAHIREDACTIVIPSKYPVRVLRMPQPRPAWPGLPARRSVRFLFPMLSSFKFHQESLSASPSHKLRFCTNFLSLSPQLSKLSSATEQASLIATTGRSDSFQASLSVIYSTTLHRSSRIGRSFPQLELPLILKQPKIGRIAAHRLSAAAHIAPRDVECFGRRCIRDTVQHTRQISICIGWNNRTASSAEAERRGTTID